MTAGGWSRDSGLYVGKEKILLTRSSALFLVSALLCLLLPVQSEAATKQWIGCPEQSFYNVDPGPKLSVGWLVTGDTRIISFQIDKILLNGGKGMMSPGQLAAWAPYLDELRNAASQRVKVQIFYDDTTNVVTAIKVLYSQRC